MAEIVNRNMEQILSQFEEMLKVELFSHKKIGDIIKRHREHEYKIVKREKQVLDFRRYITFKTKLLKLARSRMKMKGVDNKCQKKIEKILTEHIVKLYHLMVKYYSTDESVWLDFIQFMTKERKYAKVKLLYDSLLSLHMSNVKLFSEAANFMVRYLKDIKLARETFCKGIRIHERSQFLYLEFFQMELEYLAEKRRLCEKNSEKLNTDPFLCGEMAEIICKSALDKIDDFEFKLSLLDICSKYKFMKKLQDELNRTLKTDHCYDADMWKHKAKLQTEGEAVVPANEMDTVFEEVVKKSRVDPAPKSSYLDWIISRNDISLAREVFSSMSRTPPYDIKLFRKMIEMEISQPEIDVKRIRELFTIASMYFGSAHTDIWLDNLKFETLHGNAANATNIYWQAVKQLEPALVDRFVAECSILKAT